jgi:hypothetical protein
METKSNYLISDFVQDVLKNRFSGIRFKQQLNEDDDDKLNFACPYCGDSDNDVGKKRGNLYLKTATYKCFNDGCLKFAKLSTFVSDFAMKYSLPIPKLSEGIGNTKVESGTKRGALIEFLMNPKVKDILIDFETLADRFFLTPCIDAPVDSPIGKYIRGRNLTELPSFAQSCYFDNRQDKMYIFNLDLRSGRVLGLSIRRISDDYTGPKYDIKNYSQFIKNGLIPKADEKMITKIDIINSYYNILNIKFNQPILVLEGQIDAMFLDNAIATTGVTKSKNILGTLVSKVNARILFDNDDAGKKETFKLINDGYRVFLWSKLIMDLRRQYPNERRQINGIKDINNLYNFYIDVGNKMSYVEFNVLIMGYFSESVFDLIYV